MSVVVLESPNKLYNNKRSSCRNKDKILDLLGVSYTVYAWNNSPRTLRTKDKGEGNELEVSSSLAVDPESPERALAFVKQAKQQRSFLPVSFDMA